MLLDSDCRQSSEKSFVYSLKSETSLFEVSLSYKFSQGGCILSHGKILKCSRQKALPNLYFILIHTIFAMTSIFSYFIKLIIIDILLINWNIFYVDIKSLWSIFISIFKRVIPKRQDRTFKHSYHSV